MVGNDEMRRWVIRVRVADRAGALTSIASAFSNRGISIDTVVGHSHALSSRQDGTVVVTFSCTEADKDAIVQVTRRLTPGDVVGRDTFLTCELVRQVPDGFVFFVAGSPFELDPILSKFIAQGILTDIVYSVLHL